MQRGWSMYNKEEKLRIDDLRLDQVRTILLAIPADKMPNWYACQEGDLRWQLITEIADFYEDVRAAKGESFLPAAKEETTTDVEGTAKPAPQRRPLFEDPPKEMTGEHTLAMEEVHTKERRTARRYVRNLLFRVEHGGESFESETVDISMSGLSLKAALPPGLTKTFRAELCLNGSAVKVLVSKVSETKLKLMEAEAWHVIRQWIVNW